MKFRNTIILVVIALALGAYVVFFEMKKDTRAVVETPDAGPRLSDIAPGDVVDFAVRDGQSSVHVFRLSDGVTWMIEQPQAAAADPDRVQRAIALVARAEVERSLAGADAGDLTSFGLERPAMDITIETSRGEEWILLIGDQNPGGSLHYVMEKNEETVYMISSSVVEAARSLVSDPPYRPTPPPMASSVPAK